MTEPVDRGFAIATFQIAMLGAVTPNLRAATLDLSDGVRVRFVYADPIDDEIRELVSEIETEILSDFDPDVPVGTAIETDPYGPVTVSGSEFLVFHRRE